MIDCFSPVRSLLFLNLPLVPPSLTSSLLSLVPPSSKSPLSRWSCPAPPSPLWASEPCTLPLPSDSLAPPMALRSLGSTVVCHASGFTGLPRVWGYALVRCHPDCTTDFRLRLVLPPLWPHGLLLPTVFLSLSLPSPRLHLVLRACSSPLALQSSSVTWGVHLLRSAWVSTSPGSTSVGQITGSTLAFPSIGCAVCLHPNDLAQGHSLAPPSVISSMALSSLWCFPLSGPTPKPPPSVHC